MTGHDLYRWIVFSLLGALVLIGLVVLLSQVRLWIIRRHVHEMHRQERQREARRVEPWWKGDDAA